MKKIRILSLFILLCLVFTMAAPSALALDPPTLDAEAALVVDLDSGRPLFAMNSDQERAPASLTKVMTVLLALEAIDRGEVRLDDMITAQDDCREGLGEDSSSAGILPGVVLSMRELLYCAMVGSANEACNVIGSYLDGSVSAFVDRMNQRAQQLGCVHTHFVNTNGLPADGHYSSAWDLYLITNEAMTHPLFMEMANTLEYQPESEAVNDGKIIHNSNALISSGSDYSAYGSYLYEYASGVKTGYTRAAGYCLISTAKKNGINVMAIVMGCKGLYNYQIEEFRSFSDSITLYDWVFDNFELRPIFRTSDQLETVNVAMARDGGEVILHPQQNLSLLLPTDMSDEDIHVQTRLYSDRLSAPLEAGTVLGEAHVIINGSEYGSVRLVNANPVELARGQYMANRVHQFLSRGWVIALLIFILLLAAAYIVLVTRYRRLRRKHLQERRERELRRRQALERQKAEQEALDGNWKDLY